jgi:general secretion pathway protein C
MKAPAVRTVILRDRLAALTPRERVFLLAGAGVLLVFLLWLLFWRSGDESEPVLLADSPPPPALSAPTISPPPLAAPPPPMPVVTAPPINAAPVQGSAAALALQGVSGGGPGGGAALIQYQTGTQRLVRVGREIVPGMVLTSVGPTYAIASSGGGRVRLDLNRPGATPVTAAGGSTPAVPTPPTAVSERAETMDLRLGLQPVRNGGRVSGYMVKPGAGLARLGQAGLQPGDVIARVNGSELDEERLLELSWQMSNSEKIDLDVVRGGRKLKLSFVPQQLR